MAALSEVPLYAQISAYHTILYYIHFLCRICSLQNFQKKKDLCSKDEMFLITKTECPTSQQMTVMLAVYQSTFR